MGTFLRTVLPLVAIAVSFTTEAGVSKDFKARFLTQINKVRAKYCAKPLIWDQEEADLAQRWAHKRAYKLTKEFHGDFEGSQNAFQSETPEECGIAGHSEILKYVQLSRGDIINHRNDYEDWGHYANQVSRKAGVVGVGWETGPGGIFCIVNFNVLDSDTTDYGPPEWNVFPNTCRLAEPSCTVEPDKREDCSWGETDWTKADCLSVHCCYDNSLPGKPNCFYPVEAGTAKRCGTPDFAVGEDVVYSDPIGPPFKPGTTVAVRCKLSKKGAVQPTSKCQRDGTWTPLKSKCSYFCAGSKNKRTFPPIPFAPAAKWTEYFCTDEANSEKYCYDAETNSCFYPFTDSSGDKKPVKIRGKRDWSY